MELTFAAASERADLGGARGCRWRSPAATTRRPAPTTAGAMPKATRPLELRDASSSTARTCDQQSPILVRHLQGRVRARSLEAGRATGRYALLKTYPICRWSGELGPKVKEGDRQAPEGFYTITPGADESELALLSRRSTSAIPNAFDKRTGPHRRAPDGARRLLVARLLRDDRRPDRRDLRARRASPSSAASARSRCRPFRSA